MPVDIDMVVDANSALTPFAELIGRDRQRPQGGAFNFLEQFTAAGAEVARDAIIEAFRQFADRVIQLTQREETPPLGRLLCNRLPGNGLRSRATIQRCTI